SDAFNTLITFDKYFGFVLQVVLAMGLMSELPLLIILLAILGVVTPAMLNKFRRYEIAGSFLAGAILSPGSDVFTMLLMTAPLLLLYEVGFVGAVIVSRRRLRRAAAASALILLALRTGDAHAQRRPPPAPRPPAQVPVRRDSLQDTTRAERPIDTA